MLVYPINHLNQITDLQKTRQSIVKQKVTNHILRIEKKIYE